MGETILEVSGLRHTIAGRPVLDGLSLRLEAGRVYALLGPQDSGKTTLLRVLGGLAPLQEGSAAICGEDVRSPAARRETGMLVDEPALWGELSVAGNLELQGRILGKTDRKRMGRLMKALEILPRDTGRRRVGSCPESIKMRLGAAMALLGEPRLLLLDELYSGLDSDDAVRMDALPAGETAARPMAALLTGSFLPHLWGPATDFLLMKGGRIRAHYTKEELTARLPEGFGGTELAALQETLEKEAAE